MQQQTRPLNLSIIIPTLNEEILLPRLLASIKHQTRQPKEIIIVDAFSTDRTREIAKKFGCSLVDDGPDKGGPGRARNRGAKRATQKTLLFLDADTVLPPKFLEQNYHEMKKRNLGLASCYLKTTSGKKIDRIAVNMSNTYMHLVSQTLPHIPGYCIFVKKSIHKKLHGFNEDIVLGEDIDYGHRAIRIDKVRMLKSQKIYISMRRFSEDGRAKTMLNYFYIALQKMLFGKIGKPLFEYKFGNHSE